MASTRPRSRIVPIVLGLAMLAVVVAAALVPNTGVVQAQTTSQYPPTPSSTTISPFVWLGIAALVIVAGLLVALFLLRRRKPPAAGAPPPMQTYQGPTPPVGGGPPAAAPAYLETPEDVGHAPPVVPVSKAAEVAAPAAAAGGAAAGAEPDIDSLMAELDNISGEILKRAPKKTTPPKAGEEEPDEGTGN